MTIEDDHHPHLKMIITHTHETGDLLTHSYVEITEAHVNRAGDLRIDYYETDGPEPVPAEKVFEAGTFTVISIEVMDGEE